MKIHFATQNKHKVEEASAILKKYNIEVEQLDVHFIEDKELSIQETAQNAAKELAVKHKFPVVVDDTGVFFLAYNNFPGANAKLNFNALGYEGLLALLAGRNRAAYFLTCVAYCEPGKQPKLFEGRLDGHITMLPFNLDKDVLPYERIFVPKGYIITMSAMPREEKNKISHRAQAFEKLGQYLKHKVHI